MCRPSFERRASCQDDEPVGASKECAFERLHQHCASLATCCTPRGQVRYHETIVEPTRARDCVVPRYQIASVEYILEVNKVFAPAEVYKLQTIPNRSCPTRPPSTLTLARPCSGLERPWAARQMTTSKPSSRCAHSRIRARDTPNTVTSIAPVSELYNLLDLADAS